ncbi:MAG: agmatine deiminase family protein [Acidimicrobiia bacterium]
MSDRPEGTAASLDALPVGARVPAETDPHERTLIGWPTASRRDQLWGSQLESARNVHALVAQVIARFEPVLLVADPSEAEDARRHVEGGRIEVLAAEIDDSWLRDSGPVIAKDPDGGRHALCFRFTGWGGSFTPFERDATIAARLAEHLDVPAYDVGIAGEGGALALDGEGLVVTTERCLLNPNRNPGRSRKEIGAVLKRAVGAEQVVWLRDGIAEDEGTDGHVDNVVAFFAPDRCLLQGCDDPTNPNHAIARANRKQLEREGVDVTEVPVLPYARVGNRRVPVPYVNLYPINGAVLVPVAGTPSDADALDLIGACFPGREVIGIPGAVLAYGGGGVHCITQPVPA